MATSSAPTVYQPLSAVETLAPGETCPSGGLTVKSGLDKNANGTLDAAEVTHTAAVCAGANGSSSLLRLDAEAPGTHCAAGGQKVSHGLDDGKNGGVAGNGLLEAGEVTGVEYVCNGRDGETPPPVLTATQNGAPPSSCPQGGITLVIGLDDGKDGGIARDGVLQEGEVRSVEFLCNGIAGADGQVGPVGQDGQEGFSALVETISEPQGQACPAGGVAVRTGIDDGRNNGTARDGILQEGEVRDAKYVCNGLQGAAGYTSLIKSSVEPQGSNCANGGTRVEFGLDDGKNGGTMGNGQLEVGEVESVRYVCAGLDGHDGLNGLNGTSYSTLSTVTPVNANNASTGDGATSNGIGSSDCTYGGVKLETGLDDGLPSGTAGNGTLEAGEVETSSFICNGLPGIKGDTGDTGATGDAGMNALVDVANESAGSNCATGGVAITSGLDDGLGNGVAGNGTLEAGEVRSTRYVCNGAKGDTGATGATGDAGLNALVAVTSESAGSNCATGGVAITSGLDDGLPTGTAGNGTLEAGEVEQTRYVCNGAKGDQGDAGTNGTNGTDGVTALVKSVTENAGSNCTYGGVAIQGGLDDGLPTGTAGNGVLEAGEVDQTSYACNGATGSTGSTGPAGPSGDAGVPGPVGDSGFNSLTKYTAESAGANCTNGGYKVEVGLDDGAPTGTARNGTLESGEVDATNYVCNGGIGNGSGSTAAIGLGVLQDSGNNVVGAVQAITAYGLTIRSPNGYYYDLYWDGSFYYEPIAFSDSTCTGGNTYINAGGTGYIRPGNFITYSVFGNQWAKLANVVNGSVTSADYPVTRWWSDMNSDSVVGCEPTNSPTVAGWQITFIDFATAGVPNTITPPLTFQ